MITVRARLADRILCLVFVDPRKGEIFTAMMSTTILVLFVLYSGRGASFSMFIEMIAPAPVLPYVFATLGLVQWFAVFSRFAPVRQFVAFIDFSFWAFAFMSIMHGGPVGIPHATALVLAISALFTIAQVRFRGRSSGAP